MALVRHHETPAMAQASDRAGARGGNDSSPGTQRRPGPSVLAAHGERGVGVPQFNFLLELRGTATRGECALHPVRGAPVPRRACRGHLLQHVQQLRRDFPRPGQQRLLRVRLQLWPDDPFYRVPCDGRHPDLGSRAVHRGEQRPGQDRASKVDLVGWSQGGMMPRYYINDLGGAAKVNMLVALAPSNYGTTVDGLTTLVTDLGLLGLATGLLSIACDACDQQLQGSS